MSRDWLAVIYRLFCRHWTRLPRLPLTPTNGVIAHHHTKKMNSIHGQFDTFRYIFMPRSNVAKSRILNIVCWSTFCFQNNIIWCACVKLPMCPAHYLCYKSIHLHSTRSSSKFVANVRIGHKKLIQLTRCWGGSTGWLLFKLIATLNVEKRYFVAEGFAFLSSTFWHAPLRCANYPFVQHVTTFFSYSIELTKVRICIHIHGKR